MAKFEGLLDIKEHSGAGFQPLIDFGAWRVVVLRYSEPMRTANLQRLNRHDSSDESFVLLEGRGVLFVAQGKQEVGEIMAVELGPLKVYNVRRGVWHTNLLSRDGTLLIVENVDTGDHSASVELSAAKREQLRRLVPAWFA